MKKIYTLLFFLCISFVSMELDAQRYLEETFSDVEVEENIIYGQNTTILPLLVGQPPAKRLLNLNLMTPAGDTETNRPLIILLHTGNFLPQFANGAINGTENDPYVVNLATKLAKLGYAVALADYRKGWNPLGEQEVRTGTLINAAYRGVQDATTCARFFRKSVAGGNPYGVDPDRITIWGVGTGGYISLAASSLDSYTDVLIPKFFGSDIDGNGTPDPFVIQPINGDPFAETIVGLNPLTGDTLNHLNHTEGWSNEFQLCVNMGGAVGDTSWIDANDPPMISFHVPTDPFAPYEEDILIVPTTGDLVVEVQGSYTIQERLTALGNNTVFENGLFNDDFTDAASQANDGLSGLFPFRRPNWDLTDDGMDNPVPVEASPWEFWDETTFSTAPLGQVTLTDPGDPCEGVPIESCNWHLISLGSNPDMSFMKADTYQDSIVNFFAPRACLALNLPDCVGLFSDTEDLIDDSFVKMSPNPTSADLNINASDQTILAMEVYDLQGRLVKAVREINDAGYVLNTSDFNKGMYVIKLQFEEGIVSKRVMFQ
jgi:hypothetical protein